MTIKTEEQLRYSFEECLKMLKKYEKTSDTTALRMLDNYTKILHCGAVSIGLLNFIDAINVMRSCLSLETLQ
jgi:hypothetical protein